MGFIGLVADCGAADGPLSTQTISGPVSASDVLPAIVQFKRSTEAGLPAPYLVEGQRIFQGGPVLAAEEIIFHPGSRLILAGPYGAPPQKQIIAKKITILPGGKPPVITWDRGEARSIPPPPVGKAAPGPAGAQEGANGGTGATGVHGNAGFPGQSALTVYLAVGDIVGGDLYFDLRGQDGGPGGEGQEGGDGGIGMSGTPGSSSLFDCSRGGGNGGRGGAGGTGGAGGEGGKGGDGGSLVLMAAAETIDQLVPRVRAETKPGVGGPGGRGGRGGKGGPGGEAGRDAPPFCGGGAKGPQGPNGTPGPDPTVAGPSGAPGRTIPIPLNEENRTAIGL